MISSHNTVRLSLAVAVSALALATAGCTMFDRGDSGKDRSSMGTSNGAGMSSSTGTSNGMGMSSLSLSGAEEVPPNSSNATGTSTIRIASDKSVSGNVTFRGMTATAAHIHDGARGSNGPIIVPLKKTSDTTFEVPAGAMLTDAQYDSFQSGNLYVNVHSKAHPGGEIRAQLIP